MLQLQRYVFKDDFVREVIEQCGNDDNLIISTLTDAQKSFNEQDSKTFSFVSSAVGKLVTFNRDEVTVLMDVEKRDVSKILFVRNNTYYHLFNQVTNVNYGYLAFALIVGLSIFLGIM